MEAIEKLEKACSRSVEGLSAKHAVLDACRNIDGFCEDDVKGLVGSFSQDFDRLVAVGEIGFAGVRRSEFDIDFSD